MHRKVGGQTNGEAINGQAVDDIASRVNWTISWSCRDDAHVVAPCGLGEGQPAHLGLDASRARQVAVRDMGDAHAMTLRHRGNPHASGPMRQDGAVATLVFLHAHPDDEALLTAGTMARASAEGHRVVLAVATDGAAGLTSAEFRDDLAGVRAAELERSAEILGTARLETWGFADSGLNGDAPGGFAAGDLDDQVARLVDLVESEKADVLVGYDPSGGYGHPDHLRVHQVARAAAAHVRDHRPLRQFEATLPREPIARAVRTASALRMTPAGFDPAEFDRAWTPGREITHRVDVRHYASAKRASMAAHASQAAADDSTRTLAVLTKLPGPAYTLLLGTEFYVDVP